MASATFSVERVEPELPTGAPQVRITAGIGSANQKTWNLRRAVTVLGSARPAHIVLHDNDVSKAHCVIVHTGHEVLLKDLYTSSGTFRNQERVELVALQDGDVITVGATRVQVAINVSESPKDDSGCGVPFVEPTRLPHPVLVRLEQTETQWKLEDAVALIGRHASATVRLDHLDVSTRHAVLFRFGNDMGVFDLGSRCGISVNGGPCPSAVIRAGDRLGVGPCTLAIGVVERPGIDLSSGPAPAPTWPSGSDDQGIIEEPAGESESTEASDEERSPSTARGSADRSEGSLRVPPMPIRPSGVGLGPNRGAGGEATMPQDPGSALEHIDTELTALQRNIGESWDRLNRWHDQLRLDAQKLSSRDTNLDGREKEIDSKDAALRGQLHDLTRYHEQITARERELAAALAHIQSEQDKVTTTQADLVRREGDFARRNDELQRREHVLAQRWARLLAAACPHCGKLVRPNSDHETA